MISMLKAIIADPSPGPSVRPSAVIHYQDGLGAGRGCCARVCRPKLDRVTTRAKGAWGHGSEILELGQCGVLHGARGGGPGRYEKMARETLMLNLNFSIRLGRRLSIFHR
jgi:hypothetical protein